jgi:hypothetical protein
LTASVVVPIVAATSCDVIASTSRSRSTDRCRAGRSVAYLDASKNRRRTDEQEIDCNDRG